MNNQFCQKLKVNGGCLEGFKKLVRNTTKPKYHTVKNPKLTNCFTKRIESLIVSPGEHYILAQHGEEAMSFQKVQLKEGRGPIINQAQFIRAVTENIKQRLFATVSDRQEQWLALLQLAKWCTYIVYKILLVKWLFWIHTTGYMKISIWRRRSKKFVYDLSSQQPRNSSWFYGIEVKWWKKHF